MYERIFENDIIFNVSSEYFSITGNVIHIQNKLTLLICGLTSKPSDLSFRFNTKITALYPARLVRLF